MNANPKRRKYRDNPYTLMNNEDEFCILFIDSSNNVQIIEVPEFVYDTFNLFELEDLSQMNEYDRHIEHMSFDDISFSKITNKQKSLEDEVINKILCDTLKKEISKLPEIQKRRLVMYFFNNMKLKDIALLENCSPRAVKSSIDISISKLKKILKY